MVGRTFLGRYEAIRLLGEGGMGRVYLAKQADLGRHVVVKVMHDHIAADAKFRDRFQRETLLMARFQHPYVVTLYDASLNDPEGPCIVMEYIKGITLDTLAERNGGRLSPGRVARLLSQLCEALQAAHGEGIIHRDLKPTNLMVVDSETPYEKIKVMDFGLAKLFTTAANQKAETGADFAVGTPGYISPEQVRGEELDHRSDIYSVGVILYELLTGRLPFNGEETMDVLLAHATEPPPPFSDVLPHESIDPEVEDVVQNCLSKNPNDRPASARDLALIFTDAVARSNGELPPRIPLEPTSNADETPSQMAAPLPLEANTIVHKLEAWMPDSIASFKLRGFVQDMGGQVLESVPGKICVRIGEPAGFNWFGFRKRDDQVDMELRLERSNPGQQNLLHITVVMRAPSTKAFGEPRWRERCAMIFCELRSYLAGASIISA